MIIYDIMPPINRASTDGQIELERAADRLGSPAPTPMRFIAGPFLGTSTMVRCGWGSEMRYFESLLEANLHFCRGSQRVNQYPGTLN
jgi:hypothetical protein